MLNHNSDINIFDMRKTPWCVSRNDANELMNCPHDLQAQWHAAIRR